MWKLNVNEDEEAERHQIGENENGSYNVDGEGEYETLKDAVKRITEL